MTYKGIAEDLGVRFKINDYDLAFIGDVKKFKSILRILKLRKFSIIKSRPYYLKLNEAFQIVASKRLMHLDIAVVKDINHLGHFNWESILWHFPSGRIYDPYDSVNALRKRKLLPTCSINEENPFILASRLVNLCARFNIDFCRDKNLLPFLKALSKKIKSWKRKDYFHGVYAREHASFNIFRAIVKSHDCYRFIKGLQRAGLLEAIFPELKRLTVPSNLNKKLRGDADIKGIIRFFEHSLSNEPKKLADFRKRLEIISGRLK